MIPLPLYPYPGWLTPQIPATDINAISYEEMLKQFIYKLNEAIKRCNDVQEFSEEVKRILEDMNDHISTITERILTEMYENGQLEEILGRVSLDYFSALAQMLTKTLQNAQMSYNVESEEIYFNLYQFYNE